MAIEDKFIRDLSGLFNYSTDTNPTTQADYMAAVKNWIRTEEAIVDSHLWQPTTVYNEGSQVRTPSLPSQYVLVCTTAGTSGNSEPDYTNVGVGDSVSDGTATWLVSESIMSTGGTMVGNIKWNGVNDDNFEIGLSDSNNDNVDVGWTYNDKTGAGVGLRNIAHNDGGVFNIWATNGTDLKTLVGKADGTLQWDGKNIARDVKSGSANGTISVNGANVAVKGLGSAAYTPSSDYASSVVGTHVTNSNNTQINIGETTAKNLVSVSLAAGTWVITGHARLTDCTAGKNYGIAITQSSASYGYDFDSALWIGAGGSYIAMQTTRIFVLNSTTTIYLVGYTSTAAKKESAEIHAVRIK